MLGNVFATAKKKKKKNGKRTQGKKWKEVRFLRKIYAGAS